jgi:putative FmdB family regulatory protein
MPIFEYYCETCNVLKEKIVKKFDDEIKCNICCSIMKKIFPNKINFKLNGKGWFKTGGY